MWRDKSNEHYFWSGIGDDFEKLLTDLTDIEVEEQADLFRLKLYLDDKDHLSVFGPQDQKVLRTLFAELIEDTQRHSRTLGRLIAVLKIYREKHVGGRSK